MVDRRKRERAFLNSYMFHVKSRTCYHRFRKVKQRKREKEEEGVIPLRRVKHQPNLVSFQLFVVQSKISMPTVLIVYVRTPLHRRTINHSTVAPCYYTIPGIVQTTQLRRRRPLHQSAARIVSHNLRQKCTNIQYRWVRPAEVVCTLRVPQSP